MKKNKLIKGSILYKDGCRFAVWAPNADDVFVVGGKKMWEESQFIFPVGD